MRQTRKKATSKRVAKKTTAGRSSGAPESLDLSQSPVDIISLEGLQPRTLVAPHFRLFELIRSETATRQGIDNRFSSIQELHAAIHLAREVMEPIREAFGSFTPNSVFRGQALERALKRKPADWISRSQHTKGEACDVEIVGLPTLELAQWAEHHLPQFDQIICECYDPAKGPNAGWVHISLKPPGAGSNRKRTLSYVKDPASNRMVYVEGLRPTVA
ncbi:MAG: D-Ala-D-Ala carboxypeptidase family metallohydrolase [Chromatiales bacterium]|jgi:hypothetical protein